MENALIECENLYKKIGNKTILNNVSLQVCKGDIVGFIGPNGAGKTTTIKLITGLQKITSGTVRINGYNIQKEFSNAIEKVGAIVESPDLYMYMSGYENLKMIAKLYNNVSRDRIDEVVKIVGLENRIKDKVSKYSLGMRQRLGIAQAILHKPNVLILDEPNNGLDPEGIKEVRELLIKLAKEENMGILISSHNLAELETFCNKVIIIQNGEIVETSTIKDLKADISGNTYIIETNNSKKVIKIVKGAEIIDKENIRVECEKTEIPNIVRKLVEADIDIYKIEEEQISLESAFLKKTGGNKIG